MGENGVVLEHHADIPLVGIQVVDYPVIKANLPAIYRIESCNHTKQSCLAASGGTK